jgi:uncharacterized RDD family membrane protein YckC
MPQFQRSTWATLLFAGMFVPFLAALFSLVALKGSAHASGDRSATTAPATTRPLAGPGMVAPPRRASYPMFAAGDEWTLWIAHPLLYEGKDPAFELMSRTNTAHTWKMLRDVRGVPTAWGYPKNLAAFSWPQSAKARAVPVIFLDHGGVRFFTSNGDKVVDNLPRDHTLLAAAGSDAGVFAITLGPPSLSTTRPGDVLNTHIEATTDADQPTTTSQPATTTSKPAPPASWVNAYWMKDSRWIMLPPLGIAGEANHVEPDETPADVPSASALIALGHVQQRLVLLWVEPSQPNLLIARGLDYKVDGAKWTRPAVSHLPAPLPQKTRLLTLTIDQVLHVFWPTASSTADTLELHGGRIVTVPRKGTTELTLPPENFLPPLVLKGAGDGLNPATDVVVGPAENSIAAVVSTRDNTLVSYLFNDRGGLMSGPDSVEPQAPRADVQFARNIMMLLLILMLTLSFWQWRQRPGAIKLPKGMTIARPAMRAVAFLIDLAIPYVIVCVSFGLWEDQAYITLLSNLAKSILNFEVLFASPALMTMLGIYLAHVMIGELFFRRSIGKALTGLQVLMVDGTSPTLAATVVRNVIRLPELLLGILVIYMMISPYRQRLGDLIGRTLVIAHKSPEVPADPDDAE